MIVTVGGIKGGTGKTTVATHLACIAAAQSADVLLVDADDQETAADFTAARKEDHPEAARYTCTKLTGRSVRTEILELAPKYEHIIIDTGGRDTTSQRAALAVSHVLLVPFAPRSFDIWTLNKVAGLVEEMRAANADLQAYVFLNRTDPQGQGDENQEAAEMLKDINGLTFIDTPLGSRKAFAHAASQGLAVTELIGQQRNARAIEEIMTLYKHCFNVTPNSKSLLKTAG
ncbi:MAG: AAA family ATPase [Bryobacterales bacterium]|nr:AAA family ATPase [Bryobacterales bacterium]